MRVPFEQLLVDPERTQVQTLPRVQLGHRAGHRAVLDGLTGRLADDRFKLRSRRVGPARRWLFGYDLGGYDLGGSGLGQLFQTAQSFRVLGVEREGGLERFGRGVGLPPISTHPTGHHVTRRELRVASKSLPDQLERLGELAETPVGVGERCESSPLRVTFRPEE